MKNYNNSEIKTSKGIFKAKHIIFCGGLFADRLATKDKIKLNTCIYSINKNGKILSINYSRLWKLRKSYGYKDLKSINDNKFESKPKNDGIYLLNCFSKVV